MTGTSFVTRISLSMLCVLALASDAGATRPASPAAPAPQPGATATNSPGAAKTTLAAMLGSLVSAQTMHLPCYAFTALDVGSPQHWRRKLSFCYVHGVGRSVQLAIPLHFPQVKGQVVLRELRCASTVHAKQKLEFRAHISGDFTGAKIEVTKLPEDPVVDTLDFDDLPVDPKERYDLVVDLKLWGSMLHGPESKGFRDCELDYLIIGK